MFERDHCGVVLKGPQDCYIWGKSQRLQERFDPGGCICVEGPKPIGVVVAEPFAHPIIEFGPNLGDAFGPRVFV